MKQSPIVVLALSACLLVAGCFQHTYTLGTGAPEGEIVYKHWHHHWLFGLIRPDLQKNLEVEEHCPSGNATIHQEVSFVNGLIDVLIGFVYSPTTVTIQCDDGQQAELELSGDEVAELVEDPLFLEVVAEVAPQRLGEIEEAARGR